HPVLLHLVRMPAAGRALQPADGARLHEESALPRVPGERDDARPQVLEKAPALRLAERARDADVAQLAAHPVEPEQERADGGPVDEPPEARDDAVERPLALHLDHRPRSRL